jgi:hypothetical protein
VHVTTVRRYEARGLLRPSGDKGEERVFDEAQVQALARVRGRGRDARSSPAARDEGSNDAAVIRMLRAGHSPEAVVVALELPAARVQSLFTAWRAGFAPPSATAVGASPDEEGAVDDGAFTAWERAMADAFAPLSPAPERPPRGVRAAAPRRS